MSVNLRILLVCVLWGSLVGLLFCLMVDVPWADTAGSILACTILVVSIARVALRIWLNRRLKRAAEKYGHGDYAGAIAEVDRLIACDPRQINAYVRRALARSKQGDGTGALADLAHVMARRPKDIPPYLLRGIVKAEHGDHAGAFADFDHVVALSPDSVLVVTFVRGLVRQEHGDLAGAASDYEKFLALDATPKNRVSLLRRILNSIGFDPRFPFRIAPRQRTMAHLYRYVCLRRLGRTEAAAELASNLAGLPDGWGKSLSLYLTGNLTEAQLLDRAGQGDAGRQRCEACYFVGMNRLIAGDAPAAKAWFECGAAHTEIELPAIVLARAELARLAAGPATT